MILKTIKSEWFQDYKTPSMYIAFPHCSFKCEKECGKKICQNSHLNRTPEKDIPIEGIMKKYLSNPITKAIVCGGLEPFDDFHELISFVSAVRGWYDCNDTIVIYTGYKPEEIETEIELLKQFENIIVKFGRYIPNQVSRFDELLGVKLASDNQFAVQIS